MKTIQILSILATAIFSWNVSFSEKADDRQLYPRDNMNLGHVIFSGTVKGSDADSITLKTYRNGVLINSQQKSLTFVSDSAQFNVSSSIKAELAEYRFEFKIDTAVAAVADSVVAGDVFIIGGQSNAALGKSALNEYIRTIRSTDSSWGLTTEGAWAPLPRQIIENCKIPICLINGAIPGSVIGSHQRSNADPFSGYYGAILLRTHLGKVQNKVKAIFWYQGEWNAGYGAETSYPPQFDQLYRSWKLDYPSVQRIFLVQINTWQTAGSRELREAQRRMSHTYSDMSIMPAIGGLYYDGHGGYTELGNNLYRIVARDIFGNPDTAGINSPEIKRAYYTSSALDKIALEFDQPVFWNAKKDSVVYLNERNVLVPGFLKDYFAVNDSIWESADSAWFELNNRRIVLKLKTGMRPSTISYMPDWYTQRGCNGMSGPVLWNARKVPALTFAQFPVEMPAIYDTAAVVSFNLSAAKQSISLFETTKLYGIGAYAGGISDTNRYVRFYTPDTFIVKLDQNGVIRGMNQGTAKIIAERAGFKDTVIVTVSNTYAIPDSIRFCKTSIEVIAGEKVPVDLNGFYSTTDSKGIFKLDSHAQLQFNTTYFDVSKGYLFAKSAASSIKLKATFGNLSCSTIVNIYAMPTFVKRINIQPKGDSVTSIPDWVIDSGVAYSASKGFGWTTTNTSGRHSPLIANHLKATWTISSGDYKIDCPKGNYLIRLCLNQWLWAKPGRVKIGNDTIAVNPLEHAGDGIATDEQVWIADRRITVSGDSGLKLNIYGGISYIVLISDDGADLNLAAKDGGTISKPPQGTATEKVKESVTIIDRKPSAVPNPFNPTTTICFTIPAGIAADYCIFDIKGRLILNTKMSRSDFVQTKRITVNFSSIRGNSFASGIYFGRLRSSDGRTFEHSMILVR
ncbi:MAG: hypothetical protein JNL74_05425 [Fibrobacteres bacterium]|nr:hypothetical protein [Fibrobacterota bacterium]